MRQRAGPLSSTTPSSGQQSPSRRQREVSRSLSSPTCSWPSSRAPSSPSFLGRRTRRWARNGTRGTYTAWRPRPHTACPFPPPRRRGSRRPSTCSSAGTTRCACAPCPRTPLCTDLRRGRSGSSVTRRRAGARCRRCPSGSASASRRSPGGRSCTLAATTWCRTLSTGGRSAAPWASACAARVAGGQSATSRFGTTRSERFGSRRRLRMYSCLTTVCL